MVIKVLHDDLLSSSELCARFECEVWVFSVLIYLNVVLIFDYGIDGYCFFFVMELFEGCFFDDFVCGDVIDLECVFVFFW